MGRELLLVGSVPLDTVEEGDAAPSAEDRGRSSCDQACRSLAVPYLYPIGEQHETA
jgi:hypothetical protein